MLMMTMLIMLMIMDSQASPLSSEVLPLNSDCACNGVLQTRTAIFAAAACSAFLPGVLAVCQAGPKHRGGSPPEFCCFWLAFLRHDGVMARGGGGNNDGDGSYSYYAIKTYMRNFCLRWDPLSMETSRLAAKTSVSTKRTLLPQGCANHMYRAATHHDPIRPLHIQPSCRLNPPSPSGPTCAVWLEALAPGLRPQVPAPGLWHWLWQPLPPESSSQAPAHVLHMPARQRLRARQPVRASQCWPGPRCRSIAIAWQAGKQQGLFLQVCSCLQVCPGRPPCQAWRHQHSNRTHWTHPGARSPAAGRTAMALPCAMALPHVQAALALPRAMVLPHSQSARRRGRPCRHCCHLCRLRRRHGPRPCPAPRG